MKNQVTYLNKAIIGSYVTSKYDIIHLMIKSGFEVNARTIYGYTPLMYATLADFSSIVRLLVLYGAKIDEQQFNFDGNTSLMIAIYMFNKKIPNHISLGASVSKRNNKGFSCIEYALSRTNIHAFKVIAYLT